MSVSKELGKQIKAVREAWGWGQEYLGELCGVRKSQISKIETDARHASMALFLNICEVFGFDLVIRMQHDLQAETIELLNKGVWVSLPYVKDSIQKVAYVVQGGYFDLIINSNDGLLFSDEHVVFTNGAQLPVDAQLPILEEEQIRDIEKKRDNTMTKFVISIPYNSGSIKHVSYFIVGNYFHLVLHGSITSTFDQSKVKFARFPE